VRNANITHISTLRLELIACIIDSCVPTHSSTESAPTPLVSSTMRATLHRRARHDVGRAEFSGELLPRRVDAHRNDSLRTHLFSDSTPSNPTAPSPTTATVEPGFTFAASARTNLYP